MSDNENGGVQLFDSSSSGSLMAQNDAAAVARATQEIQAALVIAQRVGRNEVAVQARILEACKRKELAEVSEYEYSRGGTRITGPTIDLLRAIANRWGNIRYGWTEVDRRIGQDGVGVSSVRCFAWDLYTNSQSERTFVVKHWRDTQSGGYPLKDERDIYEAMANQASRRVRACLEEVIDADVVNKAVDQCRLTLKSSSKEPLKDRAVKMVVAFAEFGVTQPMIETRLGNKLDAISENQIASLQRVFKSLRDGVGQREDYFKPETSKPDMGKPAAAAPAPAPEPAQEAPAQPAQPVRKAEPVKNKATGQLRALRDLLKVGDVTEGELLTYLAQNGTTDGSTTSLEELLVVQPSAISLCLDQWDEVSARIKGA